MEPELYTTEPSEALAIQFVDRESGLAIVEWARPQARLLIDTDAEESYMLSLTVLEGFDPINIPIGNWIGFTAESGFWTLDDVQFNHTYHKKEQDS